MPSMTLFRPLNLWLLTGISAAFAFHPRASLAAPAPPAALAQSGPQVLSTQFKRQPFPGGQVFKTPKNPAGWNISIQRTAPTSLRDKKTASLINIHVVTDKTNSFQNFELSDGSKTELWTYNGLRIVSNQASSLASISDTSDAATEIDALWEIETITSWANMQELSWIKPEHFLSSYQGQESSYYIFVEEYVSQAPSPAPQSLANKGKPGTPLQTEQKYPQGMIPGVPLKPMIRAALIDVNTLLPKRVQLGLNTLVYSYDAAPTPIVLPQKVTSILPATDAANVKIKNTNVSSVPVP